MGIHRVIFWFTLLLRIYFNVIFSFLRFTGMHLYNNRMIGMSVIFLSYTTLPT